MIVTALSGCDNVSWGGIQVELQEPSPPPGATVESGGSEAEEAIPPLPVGPLAYLVRRNGDSATILPLAELRGDTLRHLPHLMADQGYARRFARDRMSQGREFVLLAGGSRVGTFHARGGDPELDPSLCQPRPEVPGALELVPSAAPVQSFLALPPEVAGGIPRGNFAPHASTYEQRVASINVATNLFPRLGAVWPPSVVEARRDIRIFELQDSEEPAIGATFVYRDGLRTGPAPATAYSLFFIASHDGTVYRPAYVWYRDYDRDGKGAPRYVAHFDWNQDGSDEVLLEVFGETHRWFAVAGAVNGSWTTVFQDPCGRPGAGGAATRQ